MKKNITWLVLPLLLMTLSLVSYSVWSFALTDPNLFLSQNYNFVSFQTWMWQLVLPNKNILTSWYLISILGAFIAYLWLLKGLSQLNKMSNHWRFYQVVLIWVCVTGPLFLSSNALSHDVFNYIFNAKMVLDYGANPHVQVALDFGFDNWTRFMHNTHTPAPYWYGWTALSLIPYYLGLGKFLWTWFLFRLYSSLALILTGLSLGWMLRKDSQRFVKLALVLLNPLVLIETISNSHNDYFMLLPALWALWLVVEYRLSLKNIVFAGFLLAISASTKLATILLLPLLAWSLTIRLTVGVFWQKLKSSLGFSFEKHNFVDLKSVVWFLASITLFLPLLLTRSQQFLPWYLSWPFVFTPLFWSGFKYRNVETDLILIDREKMTVKLKKYLFKIWPEILVVFSFSSLLRYLPWLWQDLAYTPAVLVQQKYLTWGIPLGFMIIISLKSKIWPKIDRVAGV